MMEFGSKIVPKIIAQIYLDQQLQTKITTVAKCSKMQKIQIIESKICKTIEL